MRYNGVFQDVDLQYILSGGTVKENLILHSAQTSRTYTAGYQSTGLTPVQRDARTILLNNKEGETVFVIAAPYMEDANRAVSEGVTLTLPGGPERNVHSGHGTGRVWLDDAARAYPVTVDRYWRRARPGMIP